MWSYGRIHPKSLYISRLYGDGQAAGTFHRRHQGGIQKVPDERRKGKAGTAEAAGRKTDELTPAGKPAGGTSPGKEDRNEAAWRQK